jgi:GalNAc-alpha-(1->4)-GalNAc-alpha-(1->3)-diNAcBac-PP-undecaprenol alpha-1,4-N-acetyl-D-galactosaminyltransferase
MLRKILIFYPSFERGGATQNLIKIVNYLIKNKIKIILFSHRVDKKYFNNNKYFKIIKTDPIKILNFLPIRWNITISAMLKLNLFLKFSQKDSIVFSMQNHIAAIVIAKLKKYKIIIRNSEEPLGATYYADNKFFAFIVLLLKIIFYNFCEKIIAVSIMSKKSLAKIIFSKKKITIIYNPYLNKIINYKRKKNIKEFQILAIGRLCKQKNFESLISAVKSISFEYKFLKLIIIGSGPSKKKLIKEINKNMNIKIIKWQTNLKKFYSNAKLFILPSYYEGLPNVLLDAINYGVPCISTNCSGAQDILANGRGGFIIPVNNRDKLEKTIKFAINNYPLALKKAVYARKNTHKFSKNNLIKFKKIFINTYKSK